MSENKSELKQACEDYLNFVNLILKPAALDLGVIVQKNKLRLHDVVGKNMIIAQAMEYLMKIRKVSGISQKKPDFIKEFDHLFLVGGARLKNEKFELIDAINNAVKHIRLRPDQYKHIEAKYGSITFQSLVESDDEVICYMRGFKFDYARVVLVPAYEALSRKSFDSIDEVADFALGKKDSRKFDEEIECFNDYSDEFSDDGDDPIDQMIEYCNPPCADCNMYISDCKCSKYEFNGKSGEYIPAFKSDFDFHGVMSKISGAYRRD